MVHDKRITKAIDAALFRETNRKEVAKSLSGKAGFLGSEIVSPIMKMAFLTIVKTSNAHFTPSKVKDLENLTGSCIIPLAIQVRG